MKNYIKGNLNFGSYATTQFGVVKQEDTTILEIYCYKGSEKLFVEGHTVTLYGLRSNGVLLEQTTDITTKQNKITIKLKDSYVHYRDTIVFELELVDASSNKITSPKFTVTIDIKFIGGDAIQATSEIQALQQVMQTVNAFNVEFEALKNAAVNEVERINTETERINAELERQNTIDTFKQEYAEMKPVLENYTNQLVVSESEIDTIIANALK